VGRIQEDYSTGIRSLGQIGVPNYPKINSIRCHGFHDC